MTGQNTGTWLQLELHQVAIAELPAHAPIAEHDFPPAGALVVVLIEGISDVVDIAGVSSVVSVLELAGDEEGVADVFIFVSVLELTGGEVE